MCTRERASGYAYGHCTCILTMAAPAGRCCAPPSCRATLSRAVWQSHDTRSDESADAANDYEKERADELISKTQPELHAVLEEDRGLGELLTQPRTPATAQARISQTSAWPPAHAYRAAGGLRCSSTRPTITHVSTLAHGLSVRLLRQQP